MIFSKRVCFSFYKFSASNYKILWVLQPEVRFSFQLINFYLKYFQKGWLHYILKPTSQILLPAICKKPVYFLQPWLRLICSLAISPRYQKLSLLLFNETTVSLVSSFWVFMINVLAKYWLYKIVVTYSLCNKCIYIAWCQNVQTLVLIIY